MPKPDRRVHRRRRRDHPIWTVLHALICVIGLAILVTHGMDGGHVGAGLDAEDGAGAIGLLAGGNLVRLLLKGLQT